MAGRYFFRGIDIFHLMEDRKHKLKAAFASLPHDQIDDPTLEIKLANKYRLNVPVLDEARKYAKTRETQVDVSRDHRRFISDRSRPFFVLGTEISIFVPFDGDATVFDVKPTAFDMNPPYADVVGQELNFVYRVAADGNIDVEAENARTVGQIKKYLDWLRPSEEQLHVDLRNLVRTLIAERKKQAEAHAQLVGKLRMPIKNDEIPAARPSLAAHEGNRKPSRQHNERWDVFISHASEDKEAIARPLAEALKSKGLKVWYDEFSLTIGDSLRQSIDHGLSYSRYGVVILSPHFFEKHWPQQELNGLATKEVGGKKVILPVWHEVDFEDVRQYSPTLADKLAVSSRDGIEQVVEKLLTAMK